MKIRDVMTSKVQTCFISDNLANVARIMWDHDCSCLPVLNDAGQPVGMIADRDICMAAMFQGVPIGEIVVSTVMSRRLFSCSAEDKLSVAVEVMNKRRVRRLPVLNEDGRLVGVISLTDLFRVAEHEESLEQKTEYQIANEVVSLTVAVPSAWLPVS